MNQVKDEPRPIRLVFELARADNPRLYDELVRFPQGTKRVNRLRVLAYDGLLAQYGVIGLGRPGPALDAEPARSMPKHARVTNAVFGPGDAE
ncbi:MAG: hypothetical protein ABS43_19380 [Bordetella sp. SCN 67-23]|nr:MAG: hypothetical protein ABS43_19380 [Bordetella sp. SCN 67-23]